MRVDPTPCLDATWTCPDCNDLASGDLQRCPMSVPEVAPQPMLYEPTRTHEDRIACKGGLGEGDLSV